MDVRTSESKSTLKKPMTEVERLELASKLDKELDTFIAGLEKKRTNEAWPEDRWQEEMEKHPFFMSKTPEDGKPLPPLLEGLQQLKYAETENSPEELATTYKDDGNFNFQHKNYRMGIISYTEGLRRKCSNSNLNAQLYNNRSACHYMLKNYRSSLLDCTNALNLNPDYEKAHVRKVQCLFELGRYSQCKEECEEILKKYPSSSDSISLILQKADNALREEKRVSRKEQIDELHKILIMNRVLKAVKERGIKFLGKCDTDSLESSVLNARVTLDKDNRLSWPVVLLYPEFKISDLIEQFPEDNTFSEQLTEVFNERPSDDPVAKYRVDNINLYYEGESGDIHPVQVNSTLGSAITEPNFRVDKGSPVFIIFSKHSEAEKSFLRNYTL